MHRHFKEVKGAFRGPFILQTFASHLNAVKGTQKIEGLEDSRPYGGLAIATAAVSHGIAITTISPSHIHARLSVR